MRTVVADEGAAALWKGLIPGLVQQHNVCWLGCRTERTAGQLAHQALHAAGLRKVARGCRCKAQLDQRLALTAPVIIT